VATEIRVPTFGESVLEATVGRWLKSEGDTVVVGEPVVELETEKVNSEVAADESGVIERLLYQEGETVRPGDVLALIGQPAALAAAASDGGGAGQLAGTPTVDPAAATGQLTGVPTAAPPVAAPPAPSLAAVVPPTGSGAPGSAAPPLAAASPGVASVAGSSAVPPPGLAAAPPSPGRDPASVAPRAPEPAPPAPGTLPPAEPGHVRASPLAQRMADELGVDLAGIAGSGPGGRVTRDDVQARSARATDGDAQAGTPAPSPPSPVPPSSAPPAPPSSPSATPAAPPSGARPETRERLTRRRQAIARRLVEAQQTAAMLTTFNEVDLTAVMALRARWRENFRQQYGVNLGYMSFFTRAVVGALKAFPRVNAELQGDELVLKRYYDIGIAVGDPEGLVVPVLRDADHLTFAQIEQAVAGFAQKARERTLTLEDLRGGTFTITTGGVFGSLLSTPILNPPQVGILGMHKIQDRPAVVDGAVVVRPLMYLALTYDHRVVDGREAVQFLVRVKALLEDPERLLLEA
jgi:2-oxoglutarate dehydrogenase E2 component (dihydrolipoamide succinyltransferase)